MNEFFIELSPSCSRLAWFIYSPICGLPILNLVTRDIGSSYNLISWKIIFLWLTCCKVASLLFITWMLGSSMSGWWKNMDSQILWPKCFPLGPVMTMWLHCYSQRPVGKFSSLRRLNSFFGISLRTRQSGFTTPK